MADFRTDLVNVLAIPLGHDRAVNVLVQGEAYLRQQVEAGAVGALPKIKTAALKQARPYLIAGGAVIGGTLVIAVAALVRTFRR